jgi:ligand-binding sensor domain-containing protein/class 3 adenylate cyclase/predicted metal-dependent HD superfamily phosphohydrolase
MRFLFLLALLFADFANGQTPYRFKNYTINDGLSQSSVTCILQDENHALWIGTQDGINKFDGKNIEIFTADNTKGIESQYVNCSVKTSDGKLWFGTTNGLTMFDPSREVFTTFFNKSKIPLHVESIAIDPAGNFWIGTAGDGCLFFNTFTKIFTPYSSLLPTKKIQSLLCTKAGELFINTEDKGLFTVKKQEKKAQEITIKSKSNNPVIVQRIIQVDAANILFGTNQGVFEYNLSTGNTQPKFENLEKEYGYMGVSDIYLSPTKEWFISTSNKGLFTVYPNGKIYNSTQDVFQKNGLLFNDINTLFCDKSGTIWVGTDRGISSFDPKNQGFLGIGPSGNLQRGIPTPNVWSFAEDKAGINCFIGTDVGVSKLNKRTGKFEQYYRDNSQSITGESSERAVLSIHFLKENQLLVGCVDGLYQLTIENTTKYTYKRLDYLSPAESKKHVRIYSMLHWKEEQYFIGTKSGVVLVDLKTQKATPFEHSSVHKKHTITAGACRYIYKDKQKNIWFSTGAGQLSKLVTPSAGEIKIIPFHQAKALVKFTKEYINCMTQTTSTDYWFGTFGAGLFHWNSKTNAVSVYTTKHGLPNNVVYSVLEDKNKKLWLSTNKGLCRFDPATKTTFNYTEKDGLMSNEFNLGASLLSVSGEFYFGGIYGFNYFKPENLQLYTPTVEVAITKFKLDKDWIHPSDKESPILRPIAQTAYIELNYKQRNFTVYFQPSNLSNPELVNYKYILVGADEGEITIGNTNELRFSSLSPGEYTLKIFARIARGNWSEKPAVLTIHIHPPFWGTWWFWILTTLILGVVIWFFIRKRIEYERRGQVRLEMKIVERTKEIRAQNEKINKQRSQLENEKNKVIEQQRLLQIEKDKTEKLLRNVIPESTAEELKKTGSVSARAYKKVSILFTDFVGFTKIAERMNPTDLVRQLDVFFRKFDEIIVANNLEKIKTIGDAYMCAGGVPVRNTTNPIDTCLAAIQIQNYMRKHKEEARSQNREHWELRLGINTGEVTAGVIGSERLAFDVWGATVNHAQRMEMLGEPGKVTITGSTHKLIEPYFECVFRGKAQTKSRGILDMYTVERIKPELSLHGEGVYPNERFHQIVNLHLYSSINYYKAEKHIMKVLSKGLSEKLHYHSIHHTKDVVKAVERLALMEGVTDEGLFLLKSAASYHDAGFVEKYEKNEPIGARMAEEILPKFGYTDQHISTIKELIFVTQIPHQPKNKLEEIICDADLDYLGREDFHEIADRLRVELREYGKIDSDRKWDEIQVQFLSAHTYFTQSAIGMRKALKLKHLEEIRQRLLTHEYKD